MQHTRGAKQAVYKNVCRKNSSGTCETPSRNEFMSGNNVIPSPFSTGNLLYYSSKSYHMLKIFKLAVGSKNYVCYL